MAPYSTAGSISASTSISTGFRQPEPDPNLTGLYREVPGEWFRYCQKHPRARRSRLCSAIPSHWTAEISTWLNGTMSISSGWRDFLSYAGERGIIVEVTLFTPYYEDRHVEHQPDERGATT